MCRPSEGPIVGGQAMGRGQEGQLLLDPGQPRSSDDAEGSTLEQKKGSAGTGAGSRGSQEASARKAQEGLSSHSTLKPIMLCIKS